MEKGERDTEIGGTKVRRDVRIAVILEVDEAMLLVVTEDLAP
jgi:hypothetical protein